MQAPQFETNTIDSADLLADLTAYLKDINPQYAVIDVESDSKVEKTAKLYGVGICVRDNEAFYIPIRNKETNLIWSPSELDQIKALILELAQKAKLVGHNIIYDVLVVKNNLGVDLTEFVYSDTILQRHTLKEEGPFGLKPVAVEILGEWADKAQEALYENIEANGGKTTKENLEMYKADTAVLAEYCCWDTILTFKLFNIFEQQLKDEDLYELFYNLEIMPLYKLCTIPMRDKGFPVDVKYFEDLKAEISDELCRLEDQILELAEVEVKDYEKILLDKEFPVKNTGNFPKALAEELGIPLPCSAKTGEVTLAKKAIEQVKAANPNHASFYDWITSGQIIPQVTKNKTKAQRKLFSEKYPERRHVFNLKSNDHLIELIFNRWQYKPTESTDKGKPKLDDEYLEFCKSSNHEGSNTKEFFEKLIELKKLNKLLSTYVEGILERQIDGTVYTSMLQFGTTSGRYSSRDPNLQNIPRVKDDEAGLSPIVLKYTNAIKRGFIAPQGSKIVNADYSSLEPVCFAHVANEPRLRNVFVNNEDLYSKIAIDVFNIKGCSANKKDQNYLKNLHPEYRQQAKIFCLAVVYGATAGRINDLLKMGYAYCNKLIQQYLTTYPNLYSYMVNCDIEAKTKGKVKTQFGRVRHLSGARNTYVLYGDDVLDYEFAKRKHLTEVRREYKNYLNNAKNFKIQGLAAHIVNRAMIATAKAFKENNIDGHIVIQVHDEITCIVREDQVEKASELLRDCMENTTKISVPLRAEPQIAENWADSK